MTRPLPDWGVPFLKLAPDLPDWDATRRPDWGVPFLELAPDFPDRDTTWPLPDWAVALLLPG